MRENGNKGNFIARVISYSLDRLMMLEYSLKKNNADKSQVLIYNNSAK